MNILEYMRDHIVFLDGGTGTILQARGLQPGEAPELWNLTHPEEIRALHRAYFEAGSNVVATNTFGVNPLKYSPDEVRKLVSAAVANAKAARADCTDGKPMFIALDLGPTGRMLKPYGDLDFEDAVAAFAATVRAGVESGVDLAFIETMSDSYETKAALLAVKENSDLPVFVSNAYGADGKLMTGADPAAMAAMLEGMGADAFGANCSLGPVQLRPVIGELLDRASVPVLFKPNAGLPRAENGRTVYDVTVDEFADEVAAQVRRGVRIVGGCCGTTPDYIRALAARLGDTVPVPLAKKDLAVTSSYTHAVTLGGPTVLIGERINPTGKKRFQQALRERDINYILQEGIRQQEHGAQVLDVNVGLPEIDEPALITEAVCELQSVLDLPLQVDTADPTAMEAALRRYNGKAMVNSVNGKAESMAAVFPLVKKYGGLVVALTLDESGIPADAAGRVAIAKRILDTAASYGIAKNDLIFDPLAMTVSADPRAALVTLESLRRIRDELGCHTSLGVSNVSFGLPARDAANGTFFALAMENGLSAAIMNPDSAEMMKVYRAFRVLHDMDPNCADYIAAVPALAAQTSAAPAAAVVSAAPAEEGSELRRAVVRGLRDKAGALAKELVKTGDPMRLVEQEIIPALDEVGRGFEAKTVYLPQLLMSAEAAGAAFEEVRAAAQNGAAAAKCAFVLATVHGDIHDIGKNIVRLLLENYGFDVTDLGRDVPPERIVETVVRLHAPLVGLSALMTTTVPSMAETIRQLRGSAPWCKIVVGGAVLNQEYADRIGADKYAGDAMETVRYAEEIYGA